MLKCLIMLAVLFPCFTVSAYERSSKANQTENNKAPSTTITITKEDKGPALKYDTQREQAKNQSESVRILLPPKDKYDWIAYAANLLLMIVGIGGIFVAIKTLKKIERQTKATEDSAAAALKSINIQEIQLRQWVEIDGWEATKPYTHPTATEAPLTISFLVFNPTKMPLALKSVLTTAGPIWEQGHDCSSTQMQYTVAPDSGFPVSIEVPMNGEVFTRYGKHTLEIVVSVAVEFEDAFNETRNQKFVFTGKCGPINRCDFVVSQSGHTAQEQSTK
jgi:hypothetical protein